MEYNGRKTVLHPVPVAAAASGRRTWPGALSRARAHHERNWVVNTVDAVESTQPLSTSEQAGVSGKVMVEQDERGEEPFEATIVRLDGLELERLFRQAEEW